MSSSTPLSTPPLTTVGVLYALAATAIWAGNFIVARAMGNVIPPVTLAVLRWACAVIILLPFTLRPFLRELPRIRQHIRYYLVTSLIGISLFNTLIYMAGSKTEALNMALIATSSPIFTILLARMFLGDPITPRRILGIAGALAGILLLTVRGDLSLLLQLQFHSGDLLVLGGAFSFAIYNILVRFKPTGTNNDVFLFTTFLMGLIGLLPFLAWELASGVTIKINNSSIFSVFYLGLGTSIFSFWCWTRSITIIGPSNASLVYYSLPLFSGAAAVLLLDEPILWVHVISGALILSGIILATKR